MNLKAKSNSKSGHKYVSWSEEKRSYVVSIYRDSKYFLVRTNTLEEAIDVRDKALTFYEEHGQLPKKSDLGIKTRKRRRLRTNLKAQSNSKSGHKHITYVAEESCYAVVVCRDDKIFRTRVNTLEEAIDIRDKSFKFYGEHGYLPKKSDLGLERRKPRKLKERVKKIRPVYTCKICNKEMSYNDTRSVEAFKDRGNICGNCTPKNRKSLSLEIKSNRANLLNEKYISLMTVGNQSYYQVTMSKHTCIIYRHFKSLNDAIVFRNQVLDFYKENDHLPNDSELMRVFGIERRIRLISNTPADSDNSNTGLKNIVYQANFDRYRVSIVRNGIRYSASFKTLEEAKLARKIILETYDETGVMLRSGEVRARMRELGKLK